MNKKSAIIGSYAKNPFWYQHFDLRGIKKLRGGQRIVIFVAIDNRYLYVRTMKAMNIQDVIPSIPLDNFKDHYVCDLT